MPFSLDDMERAKTIALKIRELHQPLFDEVSGILYHRDPSKIGITSDYHDYEVYDPHTGSVLPKLLEATSAEHLAALIRQVFVLYYGERETAPLEHFKWIADDIWKAWLKYVDGYEGKVSFDLPVPEHTDAVVRKANFGDIDAMVELRVALLREDGGLKEDGVPQLSQAVREYFSWAIPTGQFLAWVAEADGKIVGTNGFVVYQRPPSPDNLQGKNAYLFNHFTMPEYRNQGIATALLREAIEAARNLGVGRLSVNGSALNEGVYLNVGFVPWRMNSAEMPELQLIL